ncbi:phosphonoacetate hydrolase [Rhodopseudomonas palustris]|uniref:Phosphonoacetate hydrolase n=1 Tax=Rhodopseudomonas palustris (strain ATCC BAA-98 / CGA009) TaxID=258594 RepID=Q6N3F7_RHOPA|nr:phosphonoacetate hydrolase [Rhodopseudomonas palustris]OPF95123.1 phosphonoacetate hydrolase [Rhodopseudomonas palustris]PPQ42466.1 phosphonoacetate hydrolase [Rhodopseudomonas palustris]QQM05287.1 Phosphonoacetate hydrolase [Rhodopseudomonas palustris]RJF65478.1 phosphonoacetate hydrolase [Rhodopseudomonas palustris]WAB76631.1 phosphonoacetate hydrolase [Rhodopseudomonas palustris]
MTTQPLIEANGRSYAVPQRPVVVICLDGFDPEYLERGIADGVLPTIGALRSAGYVGTALATVPTTTNTNNTSIVTGVPPAIHGINGNYYLDADTGEEIMVTDARRLRCGTILGAMSKAGVRTAVVTAKDKLLKVLAYEMDGIAFSSEHPNVADLTALGFKSGEELVGRGRPDQYSADLSLFALDAGIRLMETAKPELIYLSTSDYVQHKYQPGEAESNDFHAAVDRRIARLIELGATVALTADHGMADKSRADGQPNVVYLEDALNETFGAGVARVICPIADPFVRHHGALGGFVRAHLLKPCDIAAMMTFARSLPGVELVLDRATVCERYQLPPDREGDFAVFTDRGTAVGARREDHDLSALGDHRLRSHGGLGEQRVPFVLSRPLKRDYRERAATGVLRNYDIFDFALNGVD